jgi:hypothetical protein
MLICLNPINLCSAYALYFQTPMASQSAYPVKMA